MKSRPPWRRHAPLRVYGYVFSGCYGIFAAALMPLSVRWMNIPPDVPVKDFLSPTMGVVCLALLGASAVAAFLLALCVSLAKCALVEALRRRVERARRAP